MIRGERMRVGLGVDMGYWNWAVVMEVGCGGVGRCGLEGKKKVV
jgi:hypothetical protein